ncbi:MAG: histidine kinase [Chitinophagales bacterium]|nr:histidine kinase [Chitinophagales bacterium]
MRYCLMLLLGFSHIMSTAQQDSLFDKLQMERILFRHDVLDMTNTYAQRVFEDEIGNIWIADNTGIYVFDGYQAVDFSEMLRTNYDFAIPKVRYFAVLTDTLGNIWMGGKKGLFVFNKYTHEKTIITPYEDLNLEYPSTNQTYHLIQHGNLVYNCTRGGFFAINIYSKKIEFHAITAGLPPAPLLKESTVKVVYPDEKNEIIWGTCFYGYFRYNRLKDTMDLFSSDFKNVAHYYGLPDKQFFYDGFFRGDTIICPSYGHGMVYFDTLNKTYQHYIWDGTGTQDSLGKYERIKSFLPYDNSQIIINTESLGIGTFNLIDHNYTYHDPQDNAYPFRQIYMDMSYDRHGRIWVDKWRSKAPILPPKREAAHFINISKVATPREVFDQVSLFHKDSLSLKPGKEDISIDYTIINALHPKEITYDYQLSNKHADWQQNGNKRSIELSQLSNGSNILLIRARRGKELLAQKRLVLFKPTPFFHQPWFLISCAIALFILLFFLIRRYIQNIRNTEQQKAANHQQLLGLEAKALKNQMNPHFIFNSLNSIKSLIQESDDENAIHYLNQFSKFVRKVLSYSEQKQISLEEEIEMCRHYLEIEKLRFDQSFKFSIDITTNTDISFMKVPPLILQPFLENAIWHGLLHKEGERILSIQVCTEDNKVKCIIEDNGIGRKKAQQLKSQTTSARKSFGTQLILDRLKVSQEMYQNNFNLTIIDLEVDGEASGTRVELIMEI